MSGSSCHTCLVLFTLAILGWGTMCAQTPRQGFVHLTMEQGLPSNHVIGMLFDKQGYLWAATSNRLSRYDEAATQGSFV
jgi:ligand-binding sensor domain-containing protein